MNITTTKKICRVLTGVTKPLYVGAYSDCEIFSVFFKNVTVERVVICLFLQGGFFVWIQLPTNMNCDDLMELCLKKYNVTFACGNK